MGDPMEPEPSVVFGRQRGMGDLDPERCCLVASEAEYPTKEATSVDSEAKLCSLPVVGMASPVLSTAWGCVMVARGPLTEEQRARMPQLYSKGQSGNPRGATSLTMQRTHANARRATEIRERLLVAFQSRIATIEVRTREEFAHDPAEAEEMIERRISALLSPDLNRLLADSESRGLGAPRQIVEAEVVHSTRRPDEYSDEELAAIAAGDETLQIEGEFTRLEEEAEHESR